MHRGKILFALLFGAFLGVFLPEDLRAASFQGLDNPTDTRISRGVTWAYGISADGSVVVGYSTTPWLTESGQVSAFRWDATNGMVPLDSGNSAVAVSGDGSIILGTGTAYNGPVRWEGAGGPVAIRCAPPCQLGEAWDISVDGSVIVGAGNFDYSDSTPWAEWRALKWDAADGETFIGDDSMPSAAFGVNGDGSVIVGRLYSEAGSQAARWDAEHGWIGLGTLSGQSSDPYGVASDANVSADGSVVIGTSMNAAGRSQAFRWDAVHGMVGLAEAPTGQVYSRALGVSADGSIVVGFVAESYSGGAQRAVYWDAAGDVHDLNVTLRAMGVDLTGWTLLSAHDVSADGRTIVGVGHGPTGTGAWMAVIPEPGVALLVGSGLAVLACLRPGPSVGVATVRSS